MRYSFMTFSTPELPLAEILAMAKDFGYDGIEPRIGSGQRHGIELASSPEARHDAWQLAEAQQIAFACVATSCVFANPETNGQHRADLAQAIALAADIGAPCIRVFGGQIPAGVTREAAIALVAESLLSVADLAEQRGVSVCLETHDDWCNPAHVAEIMRQVDHPAIAVNWDIMHPVRTAGVTIDDSFALLRPWIRHLHIHDGTPGEPLTLLPIGEGAIDHRRAIALLYQLGYTGFLSGEWIGWEPAAIHLPRELATLKRYESGVS